MSADRRAILATASVAVVGAAVGAAAAYFLSTTASEKRLTELERSLETKAQTAIKAATDRVLSERVTVADRKKYEGVGTPAKQVSFWHAGGAVGGIIKAARIHHSLI
jgi:Flp pilus assembly protein TadB